MGLKNARVRFNQVRKDDARILVRRHATEDHPERGFMAGEIVELVQGPGVLRDNHVDNPADGSFVWHCKDARERHCEITIVFDKVDGEVIIVISAFRRI